MFYTKSRMAKRKIGTAILTLIAAGVLFAQTESNGATHHGVIPEDLLRPRRQEAPRYPVDIVIGPLGRGRASVEAYTFARSVAGALLAGNNDAPALSAMNRVFLEDYMAALDIVNPRSFRIGSGQENPDGSVSFLIRFIGRDHGITGELFVRREERRPPPPPPVAEEQPPDVAYAGYDNGYDEPEAEADYLAEAPAEEEPPPPPLVLAPAELVWIFDDLVLESPRSREEENQESRQRFGFSVYHRLF